MIKKVFLNISLFLLIFLVALILTLPKKAVWFKFEELAYQKEVVIDGETLNENPLFLTVENGEIIFSGMSIATFEIAKILPLLIYDSITIENIRVGKDMTQFKELSMDSLGIEYSIFLPLKLMLNGVGDFGELKGRVNLKEKTIDILIFPTEKFKKVRVIMKHFKKHENGGYIYNAKF